MNKNIICMKNGELKCVDFKDIAAGDIVYMDEKPIVVGASAHISGDLDEDGWIAHCEAGKDILPETLDHVHGELLKDIICDRDGERLSLHFRELKVGDTVYIDGKQVHIDEDPHHAPGEGDYNRWLAYGRNKEHILPEDLDCLII